MDCSGISLCFYVKKKTRQIRMKINVTMLTGQKVRKCFTNVGLSVKLCMSIR